jgi:hypothetical protein
MSRILCAAAIASVLVLETPIGAMAQSSSTNIDIDATPRIEFQVVDPLGRVTGRIFGTTGLINNIPGAYYGYDGEDLQDDPSAPLQYRCVFTKSSNPPPAPLDGDYKIRAYGMGGGPYSISFSARRATTRSTGSLIGYTAPGKFEYYSLAFSVNPANPITLAKVARTSQASGGIFATVSTLRVTTIPTAAFRNGPAMIAAVATIRWLTSYNITLGNVASTYGFAKWDSLITIGSYSYQKFRTTAATSLNWLANTEYELFNVPVSGGNGTGTFELTNGIPGGEWYIDIDYSDKSDTNFYARTTEDVPLPIVLSNFSGSVTNDMSVALTWTTQSEVHNYGFEVQRSRDTLGLYTTLPNSFVPGHGTTNTPNTYAWTDTMPGGGTWAYRLKQINLDGSYEYFRMQATISVPSPSGDVSAAVLIPTGNTISVRAKSKTTYGGGNSLRYSIVTLRWATNTPVTLGTISSPTYGFAKSGSVTTNGGYNYQKFVAATSVSVNWSSGTEYELFSIPISGPNGLEVVEISNALKGGRWLVNINGFDKSDTVSYQPMAYGYVYSNKSNTGGATAYNHARHVAVSGTKFHEVFGNAGEIIYRRKDLSSGTWEVTSRLSTGNGTNDDASIIVASNGYLFAVWQHYLTASTYNLSGARSTNGGANWVPSPILAGTGTITVSSDQLNIFPVIAQYSTTQIVVVFCTSSGLKYVKSADQGATWSAAALISTPGYNSTLWFPSLAKGTNFLILTYDTRYSGAFSTKYNGSSWATPVNMCSAVGTIYDRYSSVIVDNSDVPLAAWCAQRSGRTEYRIVFRQGVAGGASWSSTYTEWTQRPAGISDYYPSITSFQAPGGINIREILWHTSNNQIGMNQWAYGNWYPSTLSTSGMWANNSANAMVRVWTDQSANPYEVKRSSYDGSLQLQSMASMGNTIQNDRRLSLESESSGSFVSYQFGPMKIVGTKGDTTELQFKPIDQSNPQTFSESQSWDYLGTDTVTLPTNAKYLVFDADIQNVTRQDSTNSKSYFNIFTGKTLTVSVVRGGKKAQVYSESVAQTGRKVIDISAFGGQTVAIRPTGTATRKAGETISVGLGDIFAPRK